MFTAIMVIGGLGLVGGVCLAVASKIFYVYVDPKILAVEEELAGANCGGCGYPGCASAAVAIARGEAPPNACVASGPEAHGRVAAALGVELREVEPDIARPGCYYGVGLADLKFEYDGVQDCRAALLLDGGSKLCPIGCLGLGTCAKSCPFGAIRLENGLPVVNAGLCTGCGTCERVCPKNIITLSSNARRVQHEYSLAECSAPCQRACPAGIDIRSYIGAIAQGRFADAVRVIKQANPFAAVCGRICVHPCEDVCRRNLVDEPVAINNLKRFAADYVMRTGEQVQIPRAPVSGHRVAVIGGGAEGLTAAYFLNRLGHEVTVFEETNELGGLLRTGLPENRLPREVLDWEIRSILEVGIEVRYQKALGRDMRIDSLLGEGYDAVLLATGGWDTRLFEKLRGEVTTPIPGVRLLVDFLGRKKGGKVSVGRRVAILGGGEAGLTAARLCRQEGAQSVALICRTAPEGSGYSPSVLEGLEKEGIRVVFQRAITRLEGQADALQSLELAALSENGADLGEREELEVDLLLVGAGRFPGLMFGARGLEAPGGGATVPAPAAGVASLWEALPPYAGPFSEEDLGLFRPGESSNDYKAVVEAIGAGRRSAGSVHRLLNGTEIVPPKDMIRVGTTVLDLKAVEPVSLLARHPMPELAQEEQYRAPDAEVALGYSEEVALEEAKRCLQCGLICYRREEGLRLQG